MAIYRFRVSFEDYEDVYRDIDMPSKSTFLDLHKEIHKSTGYQAEASSSFYESNDQWKKGREIAYLPTPRKVDQGVLLMEDIRIGKFIDDPHQKFYYVYNFDRPYDFYVELLKILKEEEGKEYPSVFRSVGQAPKQVAAADFLTTPVEDDDDEVMDSELVEEEYGVDEEDEYSIDEGEGDDEEQHGGFGIEEEEY